jgi:phenylacetate-coenzyme A ligase PaaK-like adenylate-forming protein/3-hydroxymyristoyl/3-hydroxydecanoyl-(acyl carrier protein) dehydratase
MRLKSLDDFFADGSDPDKALFLRQGKAYTKKTMICLIKKSMAIVQNFPGDECVLYTKDNLCFVVGFFALLHSGKKIILPSNIRENTLKAIGVQNILTNIDLEPEDEDIEILPFSPKAAKVIFFTSGSTGEPKRIEKTFYGLYLELSSVAALFSAKVWNGTVTLATVNMFHLYGMTFAFLYSLAAGFLIDATLIETPEDLAYRLEQHKNAFLVTSPAFLDRLGRNKDIYNFPSKPYLMTSSGAPLSKEGADAARDLLGTSAHEVFGSTETGVVACRRQLESETWVLFPHAKAHAGSDGRLVVTSDYIDRDEFVMGDAVEFLDDSRFVLKGRIDRMVKIEEKRVSLPEIEAALNAHELISKAYCIPVINKNGRKTVGACVCLNDKGRGHIFAEGRKKTIDILKTYMAYHADKVAIPLRWRFVDEIPVNEQSKIIPEEINSLMLSGIAEPVVLKKTVIKGSVEMELAFLPESAYFKGHFPEYAILPGVIQVHFAAYFANRNWKTGTNIAEIKKLKFTNIIKPLMKLRLSLVHSGKEVAFRYSSDDGVTYSSGNIVYV